MLYAVASDSNLFIFTFPAIVVQFKRLVVFVLNIFRMKLYNFILFRLRLWSSFYGPMMEIQTSHLNPKHFKMNNFRI